MDEKCVSGLGIFYSDIFQSEKYLLVLHGFVQKGSLKSLFKVVINLTTGGDCSDCYIIEGNRIYGLTRGSVF